MHLGQHHQARGQLVLDLRETSAAHLVAAEQAARDGNDVMAARHRRAAAEDELLAQAYEVRVASA